MMLLIIERLFFLSFFNGMDEGEMMKVLAKKKQPRLPRRASIRPRGRIKPVALLTGKIPFRLLFFSLTAGFIVTIPVSLKKKLVDEAVRPPYVCNRLMSFFFFHNFFEFGAVTAHISQSNCGRTSDAC